MIRKAITGLVVIGAAILLLLVCLGFRPGDFAGICRRPYPEALKEGKYLKGLTVWVKGGKVSGEHKVEMLVRNPTPRVLSLKGEWSESPASFTLSPTRNVDVAVEPGKSQTVRMTMTVLEVAEVATFKSPVFTGTWTWEKWSAPGATAEVMEVPIERRLAVRRAFGTTNYLVLFAYLGGMLFIGYLTGRKIKDARGFFIADGRMNYVVVGLSILGTYLSALTMMGLPGMSYGAHDWTYMAQLPCLVLTAMVITGLVLPVYRKAGIVSIYEFLEQRIDVSARTAASVCFILFSIGRMGLVLYLPALAFSTVTGAPLSLTIAAMAVIITIYTVMGGIEAVIYTDAIQVVIFVLGAILTLGFIFNSLGASNFVAIAAEHDKFRVIIPEFDVTKITTLWLVLETIFQTIRIYGTQQDIAQRYLTTESTEKANRSVWIAILGYIPLGFIFFFIGTALFAFYKANPDANLPISKADPIYPHFIINHLPVGIAGLVIAAIFAAAMSSIDSLMNSSSTVCIEDFYKRFSRKRLSEVEYLKKARRLTVLWGALGMVMALMFMEVQYAQIVWGKVMGIATNGILGLMALAFLRFRVNKWAAMTGFVTSYAALFMMMAGGINFLLWPVIGNLLCFFVALAVHPIYSAAEGRGKG